MMIDQMYGPVMKTKHTLYTLEKKCGCTIYCWDDYSGMILELRFLANRSEGIEGDSEHLHD